LIKEKIGRSQENDRGIYGILHDLYQEKLRVANENPDLLKLTIHEFLMNEEFRSEMSKIWTTTYLPTLTKEIQLSDKNRTKYGSVLEGGLTRAMVALLVAYTIDKSYIRPQGVFDDQKEIEFMLDLLFNGINGLKK
ncbi:MAG: hypothetical protein P4M02_01815, partial [Clostridia bacterium]|nr:hypothetical protein [Clostridia bacterium]